MYKYHRDTEKKEKKKNCKNEISIKQKSNRNSK